MQKLFKGWLVVILILAIIASFIVGIDKFIFGVLLLPLIIILIIIIILGFIPK
jgi:hypothetical protein